MSNATAQMVSGQPVPRRNLGKELGYGKRKKKRWYRLRLVIEETDNLHDPDCCGYDLDNAKPWPLGHYDTERQAIAQRNAMVMIEPKATGDPKKDKRLHSADRATGAPIHVTRPL